MLIVCSPLLVCYGIDEVDKGLTAKMGLFEEIGHAWFVVGSQLFLWNYSDTYVLSFLSCSNFPDDRRDFSRYDEQKEMIESVGLVKAKRGKLSPSERYEAELQMYLSTISPMS
jgi:hypothetical protein